MKFVIVSVSALVVFSVTEAALTVTSEQKEKLAQYHKQCTEQTGVDGEILKKLSSGDFPEDSKFKDYLFCISKKTGFQSEAGDVQKDVIVEKLGASIKDAGKARELVEKCSGHDGAPAEVVYQIVTCLYNSTPNKIILVQ